MLLAIKRSKRRKLTGHLIGNNSFITNIIEERIKAEMGEKDEKITMAGCSGYPHKKLNKRLYSKQ